MEQLCYPSISTSITEVSPKPPDEIISIDSTPEPYSKAVGVQCCLGCRYVVTSSVSTQTEPFAEPPATDTVDPSPAPNTPKDITLHDHCYSTTNSLSPAKPTVPTCTLSPIKSERSLFSDEESRTLSDNDDDDFIMSSQESISSVDTELETDSNNNILRKHVKEPKYLVFHSCLQMLFRFCSTCGSPVCDVSLVCKGSLLTVKTTCMKHHALTWNSQPTINRAAVGNLLIASSILFTGNTYTHLQNFASCFGLKFLSERVFYKHQKHYLFPVINDAWKKEEACVMEQLANQEVVNLNGDGRCDSPGHNAKYGTYTMMETDTGKIATFNVVQVSEVTSSNAMEKEGFVRCINTLEESVNINRIATDRHISITSTMARDFSHIKHQYDVWHLSKSIVKKLNKKAKLKKYEELSLWIQSISNHLWWCAATCEGNVTLLREKWKSVVHHVANKHSWQDAELFQNCDHPRLSCRQVRSTCWLEPGSPAHVALEEVVLQPKLINDLARLTEFCHTGGLEVYHSMLLKYCPKREHFSYNGMVARTQLAALDNNYNTERQQAVIQEGPRSGEARYRKSFPKTHKRWVAKPVKEKKSYAFLSELQLKVLELCEDGMDAAQIKPLDIVEVPSNIASVPAPDKQEIIQRHRSRFAR